MIQTIFTYALVFAALIYLASRFLKTKKKKNNNTNCDNCN